MKNINILGLMLMGAVLTACGGGSGSPSKPDLCAELSVEKCNEVIIPDTSSSSSVSSFSPPVNDMLPIVENFNVGSSTEFFNENYKTLLEVNPDDPNNALYYPTAGLDSGNLAVANGKLSIGNARFTIGQRLVTEGTHINPNAPLPPADYKVNTTTKGSAPNFATTTTWGDLDLTNPWKISFCVKEWAHITATANNQLLQVFLDNNQSASDASIHDGASVISAVNVQNFVPGQRVEINIPGRLFVGGVDTAPILDNIGTTSSFIQLRVPSGAVLTMSELWIGYQADLTTEPLASTCTAGERVPGWGVAIPPANPSGPATLEAGDSQITVTWAAQPRAASYHVTYNTIDSVEGAETITVTSGLTTTISGLENGTQYYVFVRGVNSGGNSVYSPVATATPEAATVVPEAPTGLALVAGVGQISATWEATEGASTYNLAYNTVDNSTGATLITGITGTSQLITELTNDLPYYVFVQAVNSAGASEFSASQTATPVALAWGGSVLHLFGTEGPDVEGAVISSSSDAVSFTASGGDLGGSHFRAYYVHQAEPVQVPFTFTARLVSITKTEEGGFTATGNSRRYGLMVMESIQPVPEGGAYTDIARFSAMELYANSADPTFVGSRAEKRDIGAGSSRGRGDATSPDVTVNVGGYMRISVDFVDVGEVPTLRARRYFSADGETFVLFNTNSNFLNANGNPYATSLYVGFHAAPRTDELEFVYDNITITPGSIPD